MGENAQVGMWWYNKQCCEPPADCEQFRARFVQVLNVHRNHKAYKGRGEEVGEEGDSIPIATLSPTEWLLR